MWSCSGPQGRALPAVAYDAHILGLVQGRVDVHGLLHAAAVGGIVVDQPVAGVNRLGDQ